jgi:N-acetylmuramoyl-L-alanine amidase
MSGAKLIKKHEPDMSSEIINDKERTNNIYMLKLLVAVFLSLLLSGLNTDIASEKTWIIVIDAGHGGKDPGAIGSISKEKNINLAIALKVGEYLEQNLNNVKVLYTRKSDVFVGLKERAEFANKNEADLFVSIHSNSLPSKSTIKGTETFIMGPSKNEQNLEVAMKENEVIMMEDDYSTKYEGFDPKSPESYIIFSLMQNVFQKQSTDFASKIQSQFKNRAGRIDRGVKQDVFWVIYMTSMPSVLVETGFITNPDEEKYLVSKEGQDHLASAIYRAARDYINEIDKKTNISTSVEKEQAAEPDSSDTDTIQVVDELKFMIQIATSTIKKRLVTENFKGITDVVELSSPNLYRYATGSFINYSQAAEYRKKLEVVYPDAFVIAVKNNKILPLQDALNSK